MIVPQTRLLLWVAVIVLPFSVVGAALPSAATISIGIVVAFAAVVLFDAVTARRALRGITVELPDTVRLTKDREGTIDLHMRNEGKRAVQVKLGLPLPREIASPHEDITVLLTAGSEQSHAGWRCTPSRRGRYLLDRCYLGGVSTLGFWSVRANVPAGTEIRVYPNLHPERRNLAALFLNRGTAGIHAQRQVGRGREFEKLREYVQGDGFDEIHWKATAKRGRPITKIFQIERTQEVYLIVDASRLSARPVASSDGTTILERYLTAALIMALVAEKQGDLFGLMTFSDRIHGFVRARNGKAHYSSCRDVLYTLQPQIAAPDFDEALTFIRLNLRRRALLVFLTSLDDPALAESFVQRLDLVCRDHLVMVNMLVPPYIRPLFSDDRIKSPGEICENLAGHLLWHNLYELDKVMHRRGVRFSLLENETMCTQLVSQYISMKRRQLL